MNLLHESYQRLFPDKELPYQTYIEYNRRLADFNANIRLHQNIISLHLNLQWKDIDDEIKIGLAQHLLLKILKKKAFSQNIDLYHQFIKNIPTLTPKTKTDMILAPAFQRVNQQFFSSEIEQPNLAWGDAAFRKLASYNFHTDTIVVSSIFKDAPPEIVDYLMYHELLHKHLKFNHSHGRSSFHTSEFKQAEHLFPKQEQIEQHLSTIARAKRREFKKRGIWGFLRYI